MSGRRGGQLGGSGLGVALGGRCCLGLGLGLGMFGGECWMDG